MFGENQWSSRVRLVLGASPRSGRASQSDDDLVRRKAQVGLRQAKANEARRATNILNRTKHHIMV